MKASSSPAGTSKMLIKVTLMLSGPFGASAWEGGFAAMIMALIADARQSSGHCQHRGRAHLRHTPGRHRNLRGHERDRLRAFREHAHPGLRAGVTTVVRS